MLWVKKLKVYNLKLEQFASCSGEASRLTLEVNLEYGSTCFGSDFGNIVVL